MSPNVPELLAPTRSDPVAAAASEVVGGPVGRYAALARHAARSAWQPAAVVLLGLSSLTVALGVLQKAPCFAKGWSGADQFWRACYSDLPVSAGLGPAMPYLPGAQPLDQPVITGLVMWLVGLAAPDGSALVSQQWYFAFWAVLVTCIVAALVVVTAASVPRAPWRAAHVALSPVLALAALVSVDLLGVLLASLALLAWGRNKVLLAGFILGLAISARTYPLVLLFAIGLLAVRSGRLRAWGRLAGTALVTCLAVSLPWLVMNSAGLLSVYRSWWQAKAGYGSLWMVWALQGQTLPTGAVTALAILGWLVALAVGAFFALSLDRRPTVAELSLVMLVIVVVTGKAVPIQAALWLLPLVALVGLSWRDHLIWAGFEATYFLAVWLYIGGLSKPDRGLPPAPYFVMVGLRMAAWLFVLAAVWRLARSRGPANPHQVLEPEVEESAVVDPVVDTAVVDTAVVDTDRVDTDRVDTDRVDPVLDPALGDEVEDLGDEVEDEVDPLAGPMAGAPDHVVVRIA